MTNRRKDTLTYIRQWHLGMFFHSSLASNPDASRTHKGPFGIHDQCAEPSLVCLSDALTPRTSYTEAQGLCYFG